MKLISRASVQWIGTLLVVFAPWVLLVTHLSSFWSVDPQYQYGWVVPFMAAFFFWEKWRTLPSDPIRGEKRLPLIGAGLAAVALAPAWLVHEAVPDWSVVNWFFALAAVVYVLSLIAFWRGRPAATQVLFPILFILCAVPWPQRLDLALVQGLMRQVAMRAADVLSWLDVPAVAAGNVLQLPTGFVGIDEACSGVRSLQATLMFSLFLGELFRMKAWARLVLICLGLVVALLFNLVRTVALVWIAQARGFAALEKWHDPAGFSVLSLSLLLLWLAGRRFCGSVTPAEKNESVARIEPLPGPVIIGFSSWILFFVIGTELWYGRSEPNLSTIRRLSIVWPTDVSGLAEVPIPDSARRILLYDDAKCAAWRDRNGVAWTFYSFVWNSGRTSTQSARIHRPENCLQGSGAILKEELDATIVDVGDTPLAFRTYLFDWNGMSLHVFYLVWEEGNRDLDPASAGQDWSGISRLQRVWLRQRNLGQQSLEIVLSGPVSDKQARGILREEVGKIVDVGS